MPFFLELRRGDADVDRPARLVGLRGEGTALGVAAVYVEDAFAQGAAVRLQCNPDDEGSSLTDGDRHTAVGLAHDGKAVFGVFLTRVVSYAKWDENGGSSTATQ